VTSQKKILIVEDDAPSREMLRAFLSHDNYLVEEAEDGKQALSKMEKTVYDLVITDIVMPEEDGFGMLAKMRERGIRSKVIAVSGKKRHFDLDMTLKTAKKFGALHTLHKPIRYRPFIELVEEILD